jgi:hypothetical protein
MFDPVKNPNLFLFAHTLLQETFAKHTHTKFIFGEVLF